MNVEIVNAIKKHLSGEEIALLPSGGLPGLSVHAASADAVVKLNASKNRSNNRGLVTLVASFEAAQSYWQELPKPWSLGLSKSWPAHLTIVFTESKSCPLKTGFEGKVALRVPKFSSQDVWMLDVLNAFPIASTSVNESKQNAIAQWKDAVDFCKSKGVFFPTLSYDPVPLPIASTIVELFKDGKYTIHREGGCTSDQIKTLLS